MRDNAGIASLTEGPMTKVIREPVDGWLILMNDEVGKRAAPGSIFRFGRTAEGNHPLVEMLQPGWAVGSRHFVPFKDEAAVREFLTGLGFKEMPRVTSGTPNWELDSAS
ncbi:hypothetical protein G3N98_00825 [Burkholderia sp. Tr-20390]|nr:hypothetical protein [Burkholderia sp. Tr-20390]